MQDGDPSLAGAHAHIAVGEIDGIDNIAVFQIALSDDTLGLRIFIRRNEIFVDQEKFLLHDRGIRDLQSCLIV